MQLGLIVPARTLVESLYALGSHFVQDRGLNRSMDSEALNRWIHAHAAISSMAFSGLHNPRLSRSFDYGSITNMAEFVRCRKWKNRHLHLLTWRLRLSNPSIRDCGITRYEHNTYT